MALGESLQLFEVVRFGKVPLFAEAAVSFFQSEVNRIRDLGKRQQNSQIGRCGVHGIAA